MKLQDMFIFIPIKYEEFKNSDIINIDEDIVREVTNLNKKIAEGMSVRIATFSEFKSMRLKDIFHEIVSEYEALEEELVDNIPMSILEEIAQFNIDCREACLRAEKVNVGAMSRKEWDDVILSAKERGCHKDIIEGLIKDKNKNLKNMEDETVSEFNIMYSNFDEENSSNKSETEEYITKHDVKKIEQNMNRNWEKKNFWK